MWVRFAVAALLALPAPALAHALLRHASPPVGATVRPSPPEIALDFSEQPEPAFSTVVVRDARGQRVDKDDLHAVPGMPTRLVVSLPPVPPGTYEVTWRAVSVDTHVTQGHFVFTVAP